MPARRPRRKPQLAVVPANASADEQKILAYVQNADDDTLACRQRHDFPPIALRNGKLPKDLKAVRQRDGCWQIKQYCKRGCGYYRMLLTRPSGILDPADVVYETHYDDPTYLSRGVRIPPRYCVAEMWRRMLEELDHQQPAAVAAGGDGPIPTVKFQS